MDKSKIQSELVKILESVEELATNLRPHLSSIMEEMPLDAEKHLADAVLIHIDGILEILPGLIEKLGEE